MVGHPRPPRRTSPPAAQLGSPASAFQAQVVLLAVEVEAAQSVPASGWGVGVRVAFHGASAHHLALRPAGDASSPTAQGPVVLRWTGGQPTPGSQRHLLAAAAQPGEQVVLHLPGGHSGAADPAAAAGRPAGGRLPAVRARPRRPRPPRPDQRRPRPADRRPRGRRRRPLPAPRGDRPRPGRSSGVGG
jgi:hypothetical protein